MSAAPKPKVLLRAKSLVEPDVHNPFSFKLKLTLCDKLKVAILSVTLFPVRLLCLFFLLIVASVIGKLTTLCMKKEEEPEPLSGYRRIMRKPLRGIARAMLFCMGFHWVKVKGKLSSSEEAPILTVAPHSSFIDALALSVICLPSGVSRKENDSIPLVGGCIRALQPVYVSRTDPNSRKKTISEIKRRASSGGKWPHVVIFPEGTCTNRKCLITFKPGAFYTGVPVQAVALKYPNRLDTVTWTWSGPSGLTLLWLTLCQFHNYLEIEILPVYKPDTEEIHDGKLYARNVREQVARFLNVPVTEHTYEDTRLMVQASQQNQPSMTGLVEYQKISSKLSMKMDTMKELLDKFAEIDANRDGLVDINEFAKYLSLPVTSHVKHLFTLYDRDDSGFINFREYLIGLALVSQPANSEEAMKLAFQVFDMNGDGRVDEAELRHILQSAYPSITDLNINCLFNQVDVNHSGSVTFEEFRDFTLLHPEYAFLFTHYTKEQTEITGESSHSDHEHPQTAAKA
ncbi:lysophosphatidylcholine acyltransferase 2-like [Pocillopora damicornis]|uniref:lysophosphatidylcholine acyltransferase 2-like n=1 Tax=Pocillopora damicornis TaxID=46731 RepID=UPI000F559406|nr:lysophosphatidylcholine acyltransferase 2-like [Pocillopora damicornis]